MLMIDSDPYPNEDTYMSITQHKSKMKNNQKRLQSGRHGVKILSLDPAFTTSHTVPTTACF